MKCGILLNKGPDEVLADVKLQLESSTALLSLPGSLKEVQHNIPVNSESISNMSNNGKLSSEVVQQGSVQTSQEVQGEISMNKDSIAPTSEDVLAAVNNTVRCFNLQILACMCTLHPQSDTYFILCNAQFKLDTASDLAQEDCDTAPTAKYIEDVPAAVKVIDTKITKLKSCPNSETRTDSCLQTLCDPCFFEKFPLEDSNILSRKQRREKADTSMAKKAYSNNKHVCYHNKREAYNDTDISMIVGKWADARRSEKKDDHLPTKCAKCGGIFV